MKKLFVIRADSAWRSRSAQLRLWLIGLAGLSADLATKGWALAKLGVPWGQMDPEKGAFLEQLAPVYRWIIEKHNSDFFMPHQEQVFIEGIFRFVTVFNTGAPWGLAAGQTKLLLAGSMVALLIMFWLFGMLSRGQWLSQAAIGCILGGALGNTHDRLFNTGMVVDYIEFNLHFPPADPWPAFNIADTLLCVGVGLLMICMIRQGDPPKNAAEAPQGAATNAQQDRAGSSD